MKHRLRVDVPRLAFLREKDAPFKASDIFESKVLQWRSSACLVQPSFVSSAGIGNLPRAEAINDSPSRPRVMLRLEFYV